MEARTIAIDKKYSDTLLSAVKGVEAQIHNTAFATLNNDLHPSHWKETQEDINHLKRLFGDKESARVLHINIDDQAKPRSYVDGQSIHLLHKLVPLVKRCVLEQRKAVAKDVEQQRKSIHNHEILNRLDSRLDVFDEIMNEKWFRDSSVCSLPHLSDG